MLLALQTFDFTWVAGAAYVLDRVAHLLLPDYEAAAGLFLALVAVPSVVGEMSFAVWLLGLVCSDERSCRPRLTLTLKVIGAFPMTHHSECVALLAAQHPDP